MTPALVRANKTSQIDDALALLDLKLTGDEPASLKRPYTHRYDFQGISDEAELWKIREQIPGYEVGERRRDNPHPSEGAHHPPRRCRGAKSRTCRVLLLRLLVNVSKRLVLGYVAVFLFRSSANSRAASSCRRTWAGAGVSEATRGDEVGSTLRVTTHGAGRSASRA